MNYKSLLLAFLTVAVGGGVLACQKKKDKSSSSSSGPYSDSNFEKPVTASSVLNIGAPLLAGTKIVSKDDTTATAADPALVVFQTELYPKLKQYCTGGCHDVNQKPFASVAVSLAYQIAKPYMTKNPDDSQMIKNIKARHNGTNPAWAADVGPAIQKVAAAIP